MLITYADRGGCGGNDLFLSRRIGDGWSEPQNLGCNVNSPYDEGAGTLVPGTQTLVFMSSRPYEGLRDGTVSLWVAEIDID